MKRKRARLVLVMNVEALLKAHGIASVEKNITVAYQ